ncbi:hypothetical protein N7540_013127 [Penicillium herquei]|nr:hypothetical protein N7540_013127 [Penicillium herquei]
MATAERQSFCPRLNDSTHTLKRVEHGRNTSFIYETARHDEFLAWWGETEYGRQFTESGQSKIKWLVEVRASRVWQHFYQAADVHLGRPQVICRSCLTFLNHPDFKSHGTSAMSKHRNSNLCLQSRDKRRVTSRPSEAQSTSPREKSQSSSGESFKAQVLDAILSLQLPLEVIEQPAFQALLQAAQGHGPNLQIPSADSLYQDLRNVATAQYKNLTEILPADAKISLSLGTWVNPCGTHFVAILASYFDGGWNHCETLLAFEALSSRSSGSACCQLILDVLSKRRLLHRVFGVKVNHICIDEGFAVSLQEALLSSGIIESSQHLIKTPGIDRVIEQCLRHFLQHIESTPEGWSLTSARNMPHLVLHDAKDPGKVVYRILDKIRSLADFLNSSRQSRRQFLSIQPSKSRLMLFPDSENCAHTTFSMLARAHKLRQYIDQFCHRHEHLAFRLSDLEWEKIKNVVQMTRPFLRIHCALKGVEEPTVHRVFSIYKTLLENVNQMIEPQSRKRSPWNLVLYEALVAVKRDMLKLFQRSFDHHGSIFSTAALLAPQYKHSVINSALPPEVQGSFPKHIDEVLQSQFLHYKRQAPESAPQNNMPTILRPISHLDRLLGLPNNRAGRSTYEGNEVTRYLAAESSNGPPDLFWKDRQGDFPVLTRLARDALAFPATDATLEKVFDIALDVSHAHGNQMDQGAFQDTIMYIFSKKLSTGGSRQNDPRIKVHDEVSYKCTDDDLVLASDSEHSDISEDELLGGVVGVEHVPIARMSHSLYRA